MSETSCHPRSFPLFTEHEEEGLTFGSEWFPLNLELSIPVSLQYY